MFDQKLRIEISKILCPENNDHKIVNAADGDLCWEIIHDGIKNNIRLPKPYLNELLTFVDYKGWEIIQCTNIVNGERCHDVSLSVNHQSRGHMSASTSSRISREEALTQAIIYFDKQING